MFSLFLIYLLNIFWVHISTRTNILGGVAIPLNFLVIFLQSHGGAVAGGASVDCPVQALLEQVPQGMSRLSARVETPLWATCFSV